MQRYFAKINNSQVTLSKDDEHHVLHVMRMKVADEIEVVDEAKLFLCRIDSVNPLSISVIHEIKSDVELPSDITLLFALTKGDKTDLVLQKATELGVKRVALIESERTVVTFENKDQEKKLARYKKIMKEASEQSHRLCVPELVGVFKLNNLPTFLLSDLNYVAYEKDAGATKEAFQDVKKGRSISLLIGPEGGFSIKEIEMVTKLGFIRTSLGKRILRAETAAIYGLSVLGYLLEK